MSKILIDSHCHMQFSAYDGDRDEVIKRARVNGVKMITVGVQFSDSEKAIVLARQYPDDIWATVGIHPHNADEPPEKLKDLAKDLKVVAIGECGLDYFGLTTNDRQLTTFKNKQKEVFLKQVELANEVQKPLMIHCRSSARGSDDAYNDIFDLLTTNNKRLTTILHFFAGSLDLAKKFVKKGFYFTFGGVITITHDYDEIVKYVPLDRILLETDAPYVAPLSHRGKRNEPALLPETAQKLAEMKQVSLEKIIEITYSTSSTLFGI